MAQIMRLDATFWILTMIIPNVSCQCSSQESCPTEHSIITNDTPIQITSPCFPDLYPVDIHCNWYITTEQPGTIIIDILQFQVEKDFDFLDVGQGSDITNDDSRIISITGGWAPNMIIIPDAGGVWLSFVSDALMVDLGFELQITVTSEIVGCDPNEFQCEAGYLCIDPIDLCDRIENCPDESDEQGCVPSCVQELTLLPNVPVNISSLNYPNNYPNDEECIWILTKGVPNNTTNYGSIVLTFEDFHTEDLDVVSIGHGDVYLVNTILELSVKWVPEAVVTNDVSMWVRFESDDVVAFKGFLAVVEWFPYQVDCIGKHFLCHTGDVCLHARDVCDRVDHCPSGSEEIICDEICNVHINLTEDESLMELKSLNFPHPYPRDLECTWLVTVLEGGTVVVVHILDFYTEQLYDILSIGYGHDIEDLDTELLKLSGIWFPKSLTVEYSEIWLHFITDNALERRGFHLRLEGRETVGLCLSDEFECHSGLLCLHVDDICDDIPRCPDYSDELNCESGCTEYRYITEGQILNIKSPGHPEPYKNDLNCIWYINPPSRNGSIVMSFVDLHTDAQSDILGVGEGNSVGLASRLMTLSGTWTPNYIIVPQNTMWMQFKSSPYVNEWVVEKETGFHVQLQWKRNEVKCAPEEFQCQSATICLEGLEHCNGYVKCPDASDEFKCDLCGADNIFISESTVVHITSPNYPLNYPLNLQCIWYFLPPQDNHSQLVIRFLDLLMGAYKDHVAVGKGVDASNETTELTRFYKSWSPLYISVRGTPAWLKFDSDSSFSTIGFAVQISWSETDNGCRPLSGFQCHDDIMCLMLDDVCDRQPQCLDQSDETYQECCGTTDIRLDNGDTFNLFSPRYPQNYPVELSCTWFVTANLNNYIMVQFVKFFTEKNHDTLTIGYGRNASSSTEIITLSLMWTPVSIIVDESNMWLRFVSDRTVVKKGFHVALKEVGNQATCAFEDFLCHHGHVCINKTEVCDVHPHCVDGSDESICDHCGDDTITLSSASYTSMLSSFNYPIMYPNDIQCTWIINSVNAASILLTFNDFFTEDDRDYLSVGRGNIVTDDSKMLYLSGKFPPNSVTAEGSEMWIEFASNDFAGRRGFQLLLHWMDSVLPCKAEEFRCYSGFVCVDKLQVCDKHPQCIDGSDDFKSVCCGSADIQLNEGTAVELQSYNFPNPYPNNLDCIWFVTALNGGVVMVQFLEFDIEIRFDYFSLGFGHNDITEDSPVLHLSGSWSPISVTSDGATAWLRFQSDVSKSGRGVHLNLQSLQNAVPCGAGEFQCQTVQVCINQTEQCDGVVHCPDETDEYQCDLCQYVNITVSGLKNITTSECSNIDCTWCIDPLDEGVTVLYMTYFHLDVNSNDRVTIGQGNNFTQENTLMYIDNDEGPNSVTVQDSRMWVKVIREDLRSKTLAEFQLGWYKELSPCFEDEFQCYNQHVCLYHQLACNKYANCLDGSDELETECCGSEDHFLNKINSTLTLTSYNYPNQYPRSTECTKFITSPSNGSIHVAIVAFDTERQFDALELGYGTNPNDRREMLPLSGTIVPNSATFDGPSMWMRFTSDGNEERSGYHLEITWIQPSEPVDCSFGEFLCNTAHILICVDSGRVCDGVPTCPDLADEQNCGVCGIRTIYLTPDKPPHDFISPNHPQLYPNNLRCLWVIIAQDIPRILLRIMTFSLERGYDFLTVGEGDYSSQSDSVIIARLTGKIKLQVLVSSQDKMWIQMVTDGSGVDVGFKLTLQNIDNTTGICDQSQFACDGADRCVTDEAQCDGFDDCLNNADEKDCESIQCPGFYPCVDDSSVIAKCVPHDVLCDGYIDCPVGDDEINCDIKRCPSDCTCEYGSTSELNVQCTGGWNETTLINMARISHTVKLSGSNVSSLSPGTFKRLSGIHILSLRGNNISDIEMGAFNGLYNLTWLDLSDTNISTIPTGVFDDLGALEDLFFWNVPITKIETNAFRGLSRLHTLVMIRNDEDIPPIDVAPNGLNSLDSLAFLYVDDHRVCCFFDSLESCTTLEPQPPLFMCGSLMQNLLLRVSMWVLGISALFGNLYALLWRLQEKTRSPTQAVQSFLIGNLAASDFLMGIYMIIIAGADIYYGDEYFVYSDEWRTGNVCRFAGFVSLLSSEGSVFFLTLISVDRLISVVTPFSDFRLSPRSVKFVGVILWTASAILSIIPTVLAGPDSDFYDLSDVCIGLPLITRPASYSVMTDAVGGGLSGAQEFSLSVPQESKPAWYFSIVIFLGVNLVCFFVIAICYIIVFISLQRSSARLHGRKGRRQREERRLAIRMAVIVGTDFICWTPVIIMGVLSQTGAAVIPLEMYTWSVVFILPINSSLNPYLYTLHSLFISKFQRKIDGEQSQGQSLMDQSRVDDKAPGEAGPSGTATLISTLHSEDKTSEAGTLTKRGMGIKLRPLQILIEKVSSSVTSHEEQGPSTIPDQTSGSQKISIGNNQMDHTNTQLPGTVNHVEIDSD